MITERYEESLAQGYFYGVHAKLIVDLQSAYQHIQILEHPKFGKILRIDGALQCSEADEAFYHEPLVHMVLARTTHEPKVVVIGGGDGGAAEEILKWQSVQMLEQIELDPEVIALSRKHLKSIHKGLLGLEQVIDHRFNLHIGDGLKFLQNRSASQEHINALILDLTDPGGPSLTLWDKPFFELCAQSTGPQGVLGLHIGAPWAQKERCQKILNTLRECFASVQPFITNIPVSGGPWLMAVAAGIDAKEMPSIEEMESKLEQLHGEPLKVIDARVLRGMVDIAHKW